MLENKKLVIRTLLTLSTFALISGCATAPQQAHLKDTPAPAATAPAMAASTAVTPAVTAQSSVPTPPPSAAKPKSALSQEVKNINQAFEPPIDEIPSVLDARDSAISYNDESADSGDENAQSDEAVDESDAELTDENSDNGATPSQNAATAESDKLIWSRIRRGFRLPDHDDPRVEPDLNWYASRPDYIDRTFKRARPYLHYIVEQVEKRGMPTEIALLPVVESAFQPFAYSHSNAAGIWQFISGTAKRYDIKINWWYDGRRDIKASTDAALNYLEYLSKEFDGDWLLALAAYNSGEGTVRRAIRNNQSRGLDTSYWDLDLPRETRGYVPKLLAIARIVEHPEDYNISLEDIPNRTQIVAVPIDSQLDLALAAEMASMSLEELYLLNPGYNRWATSPNGPHRLLLPRDRAEQFKAKLAKLPIQKRMKWLHHQVARGETLSQIARKYGLSVDAVRRANDLKDRRVKRGQHLVIPTATLSNVESSPNTERRKSGKKSKDSTTYVVKKGDTLHKVARLNDVPVKELAAWNNLSTQDKLRIGQKLTIKQDDTSQNTEVTATAVASAIPSINTTHPSLSGPGKVLGSELVTRKISYQVRHGDSLTRISRRFNVTIAQIRHWNPGVKKRVHAGQTLTVYVDVTKLSDNI